jgi:predicted nucleotidyltransferase
MDSDSDIDLILVRETEEPFIERAAVVFDLLGIVPTCDILVYTPSEFDSLTKEPTAGFWADVSATMKRFM